MDIPSRTRGQGMARPGQLVEVLADLFGMNAATVTLHNRNLREAGAREKQARGRGKGAVSPSDAANLLVSLLVGGQAKDSEESVKLYGGMKLDRSSGISDAPSVIAGMSKDHSFSEGISALIQAAMSGELQYWASGDEKDGAENEHPENLIIEVRVFSPAKRAQIILTPHRFVDEAEQVVPSVQLNYGRFIVEGPAGRKKFDWATTEQGYHVDLRQERLFGEKTIFRVASILRG